MKQIFKNTDGIKAHEVPLPTQGEKELLVAVEASVISTGTETMDMRHNNLSLLEKIQEKKLLLDKVKKTIKDKGLEVTWNAIRQRLSPAEQALVFEPMGYSNSGTIVAKGSLVNGFNVGDRVACAGAGIAAHAEYVAVPVNLAVKLPDNVPFTSAAFSTIGSIALQGIRRADLSFGETVVITGLGLLGLIAVQIAKAWGLVVIGLDINPARLDLAKKIGADFCFRADDPSVENNIRDITNGYGADAVIIYAATRSSDPANQALKICRRKARVVVVGAIGMDLQRDAMYMKELDFVMSTSYGPGRYDKSYEMNGIDYPIGYVRWTENRNMMEFVRLLSNGQIDIQPLISNTFTIDQANEAYQSLVENPGHNIASLFLYHHENYEAQVSKSELYPRPILKGKIRVGIIGAGGFVQSNHLPNILKLPDLYELVAIANRTPAEAKAAGEKYKTRYITTDYKQVLNDPEIDMVVIGTRHNLHAVQVTDAIKAGKHLLVEKPLAMNEAELCMIQDAFNENPSIHATIGFNRRYSPLTQKAKNVINKHNHPVVINYRINAGFFPPDIWIQDLEEGGGRIIGEVCHFIDLVGYLAGSEVSNIQTSHIPVNGKNVKSEDNIIITLSFKNGSIGVITYVSIGGKSMEKERIEIFSNSCSMVINDFKELQMFNSDEKDIKLKETDKGHYREIEEFAKCLKGEHSLILPFTNDLTVTGQTISVIKQIHDLN
ncbi:MAG: bi-domain-containing oxidoreductase [Ignavibacteriaceae bacterium]|nr:bi-domain-containing oxidoreductase [Ignavibacteriaceae bacterium]